ncbi:hypothetical protein N7475_009492 [Penicillium sp. IBT 31633x]|nr:hypothetical protein N7475_009492 [Penicillium sp. IBT 31633x]
MRYLSSGIIRPGDLVTSTSREVRPHDDSIPPAHEPIGFGTLRDVREENFYRGGTLTLRHGKSGHSPLAKPLVYDPYPDYNGVEWRKVFMGTFQRCNDPKGRPLDRRSAEDMMSVYPVVPDGFPPPIIGSYAATGLDPSVCSDRFSRLRVYGYDNYTDICASSTEPLQVNWDEVDWASLQTQCLKRNTGSYLQSQSQLRSDKHSLPLRPRAPTKALHRGQSSPPLCPQYKQRSAIILRTWHDMEWTDNIKQNVRSMVMELSLHSGAEYEVFILCHVKDTNIQFNADDAEQLQNLKARFVPREFQDMTVLYNDHTLETWYPKLKDYRCSANLILLPLYSDTIFAQSFQDFGYYWQLEMDSKFTGHIYHFLEKSAEFAKQQARKYLWERNANFYIPGTHGTWRHFMRRIDASMKGQESVWGPSVIPQMTPIGPKPPVKSPEVDKDEWGVGEEADLITFLPMFDPRWHEMAILAMGRVSKKLVNQMHEIQIQRSIGLASEMTAPTVALWHGLKAVYVPHPIYIDGKWTPKELGRILNRGSAEKMNGGNDSVWNWDHRWDRILYRFSYMFSTQTAEDLYRRWMGYKVDPNQFVDGSYHQDPQGLNWFDSGDLREDLYGPLCFPSMLLHTVKNAEEKKGSAMAVPV